MPPAGGSSMQQAFGRRRLTLDTAVSIVLVLLLLQLARPSWRAGPPPKKRIIAALPEASITQLDSSSAGDLTAKGQSSGRSEARSLAAKGSAPESLSVATLGAHAKAASEQLPEEASLSPSPRPGSKVLYVIRTHVKNDLVNRMFTQLTAELGPDAVFILMDDTKHPSNGTRIWRDPWTPGQQMLYVNEEECKQASRFHNEMYIEGQTPMGMMYKYLEPVDFQYIWFIDWDVLCNGHYKACFAMPPGTDQDLLATALDQPREGVWWRWDELVGELSKLPREKRWKSFFPLVRFSKKLLHRLHQELQLSSGLCELFTPTLCANTEGCTFANIPNERLGAFDYVVSGGDQRCSPPKEPDNKFYHPCKGLKDTAPS